MDDKEIALTITEYQILDRYASNHYILIDTCSLLDDSAEKFLNTFAFFLRKYNQKIVVILSVRKELEKLSLRTDKPQLASQAQKACALLKTYSDVLYVHDDCQTSNTPSAEPKDSYSGSFADVNLLSIITKKHLTRDILLITQDKALANDALKIVNLESVRGKDIATIRITDSGFSEFKYNQFTSPASNDNNLVHKNNGLDEISKQNNDDQTTQKKKPFSREFCSRFATHGYSLPIDKFTLSYSGCDVSNKYIDLFAPLAKGSRAVIVGPSDTGKTRLCLSLAKSFKERYHNIKLFVLLIGTRNEEKIAFNEIGVNVYSADMSHSHEDQIKLVEDIYEEAQKLVESGEDVVIILDSLTELALSYNSICAPIKILQDGITHEALDSTARLFCSAGNIKGAGSLTFIGTCKIDSNQRYTANNGIFSSYRSVATTEIFLDEKLSNAKIYPSIDIVKSKSKHVELMFDSYFLDRIKRIEIGYGSSNEKDKFATAILSRLSKQSTSEFVASVNL